MTSPSGSGPADYGGNSDGLRRRTSLQHDREELAQVDVSNHGTNTSSVSNDTQEGEQSARRSTALENTGRPSMTSEAGPRTVRFSTDMPRHMPQSSSAQSNGTDDDEDDDENGKDGKKRPGSRNLTIDTRRRSSILGRGWVNSPGPTSGRNSGTPASPRTPGSARARGYSLRSSLFQKNYRDALTSPGQGSVIELQEQARSSNGEEGASSPRDSKDSKKSRTSVTITPADDSEREPTFSNSPTKKDPSPGIPALPHYESWIMSKTSRSGAVQRVKETLETARKFILRIQDIPPSIDGRHIDLDPYRKIDLIDERTNKPFIPNTIRSTRYNAWSFIPRQLWSQFTKFANAYFLCISILQMIPGFSTTGTYTTIIPLLFFVSIAIAREGYDDLRRHRLDKEENNRTVKVLRAYQATETKTIQDEESAKTPTTGPVVWSTIKWAELTVGDVVRLDRDEAVPADVVVLHSTGANGVAYVETMALDGETNLKGKQATALFQDVCKRDEDISVCRAQFVVEDPNIDLYNFEGKLTLNGKASPLTNAEVIYRGSIIRNTPATIGMVIYSGEECKIRMNANKNPRIKAPALQSLVNRIVGLVALFVVLLSIFCSVAYKLWSQGVEKRALKTYLQFDQPIGDVPKKYRIPVPMEHIVSGFIIMFNTLIPLSLYVSLEIVKAAQMFFLGADVDMYDPVSDTPCEPRTSTINEELGQISYVFSDKTGTLTDNSMKFRKISVAGTAWLHDSDITAEDRDGLKLRHRKRSKGKQIKAQRSFASLGRRSLGDMTNSRHSGPGLEQTPQNPQSSTWKSSARPGKSQHELLTAELLHYIQRRPNTRFARKAKMFLLSIALCHTCLPESDENGNITYQAASPDELALVQAAQELGFVVVNRDVGTVTLRIVSHDDSAEEILETYEVLDVIEFSSQRKRMSAIVRFPDGRICIFTKGADSIVMQRLKLAALANQKMVEIESRVSRRKSMEAQHAIARKSEQLDRKNSIGRPSGTFSRKSMTMGRTSLGGLKSPIAQGPGLHPIRDEVDTWLSERERDVDVDSIDDANYYTPRPSTQLPRQSMAISEAGSSMMLDDMEDLVEESLVADEPAIIERCLQHINDFATEGLRTLLYGHRFLDEQEYQTWKKVYLDATTSLENRTQLIERAGDLIEQDLELTGATAIEDKLQKGVPEAIDKLRRANIKMWMLTGDKRETAINIGHSCRLIKDYSSVTVLDREAGEVEQHIAATLVEINTAVVAHSVVVVDGQTLAWILESPHLSDLFYELAIVTDSVVCCRASPSQKAVLVNGIRKRVRKSITLAIGDGANDIAMIQEAHVGIGIVGKEGSQASRVSDYSIAQFRFLTKLLLCHGRWNYIRTCKYVAATFWKEIIFYMVQALYQRYNGYTGTSIFEQWSMSMFNTLFTSLPVIFLGIFEKDLSASTLLAVPELYTKGQRNGGFNFLVYLRWQLLGVVESMLIFWLMYALYARIPVGATQMLSDPYAMGTLCFSAVVALISIKLQLLETHYKTLFPALSFLASVGGWFLWTLLFSAVYRAKDSFQHRVRGAFVHEFGRSVLWWAVLMLVLAVCTLLEVAAQSVGAAYFPSDVDVFQALEKDPATKRRFEEASSSELQNGWERGNGDGEGSGEVEGEESRGREEGGRKVDGREVEGREEESRRRQQEENEREVVELLRSRVEGSQEGLGLGAEGEGEERGRVDERLRRGFGKLRRESLGRGVL